jgi:hypothetical protein
MHIIFSSIQTNMAEQKTRPQQTERPHHKGSHKHAGEDEGQHGDWKRSKAETVSHPTTANKSESHSRKGLTLT